MEFISNAIHKEVERIQKMTTASERRRAIKMLTGRAKLLSYVKGLKIDNETYETMIDFRTDKDKLFKLGFDYGGEKGLGLYSYLDLFCDEKTISIDAELTGLRAYGLKFTVLAPQLKNLDFNSEFIPGFRFEASRALKKIKDQGIRETKFQFSFSKPTARFSTIMKEMKRKKTGKNVTPDMLSIPEQYRIFAANLQYETGKLSQDATLGLSISNDGFIQPFYKHTAIMELPIDDLLSAVISAGTIYSRGTLPVPERFYDIAISETHSVNENEFGISNGSIACACDCYATAEVYGKFIAEPWTAMCFTKAMIGGLMKPASMIEESGSIFYTFAGIRISRRIFDRSVAVSVYRPITKPEFLKTTTVDVFVTD